MKSLMALLRTEHRAVTAAPAGVVDFAGRKSRSQPYVFGQIGGGVFGHIPMPTV